MCIKYTAKKPTAHTQPLIHAIVSGAINCIKIFIVSSSNAKQDPAVRQCGMVIGHAVCCLGSHVHDGLSDIYCSVVTLPATHRAHSHQNTHETHATWQWQPAILYAACVNTGLPLSTPLTLLSTPCYPQRYAACHISIFYTRSTVLTVKGILHSLLNSIADSMHTAQNITAKFGQYTDRVDKLTSCYIHL